MSFPTTAAPSLTTWQMSYQGLTLGPGTPYALTGITGFAQPNLGFGDITRPRDVGEIIGLDFYDGRDILISGDIVPDSTSLTHAIQALATSTNRTIADPGTEYPLWINYPNVGTIGSMVRLRKRDLPVDLQHVAGLASMNLQFHATDPRWYATPSSLSTGLGSPGSGLSFNVGFNASFGGGGVGGFLTATNAGNYETRPILTITGPCINPSVTNATTGQSIAFGLTMATGDKLVIDTDFRSATYTTSGSTIASSRLGSLTAGSTWFTLAPGSSTIQFQTQDSAVVAATLQVQFASAYIF